MSCSKKFVISSLHDWRCTAVRVPSDDSSRCAVHHLRAQVRRIHDVQDVPFADLCALGKDSNGQRGSRSQTAPHVILPHLSKPDPLVTFKKDDIALVYGSKWKQRYFARVGDDYFVFPAQWDVTHQIWRPYFVKNGTEPAGPPTPPDNMKRPTGPLCDGCHSVNYDIKTKSVTEWNVGCERCHGPGSEHVYTPSAANIVNPAKLDFVQANDTCIQCHSQGQPLNNPIDGKYYDWPVGFHQGANLSDYWKLEEHKLGETTFTHFPDDTAHKNRMQGNDFVQSLMYRRGVTCFSCHDVHGTANNADSDQAGKPDLP